MKKYTYFTAILLVILLFGCFSKSNNSVSVSDETTIKISYEHGTVNQYENIYVIWIENKERAFIQNISICKKLINGKLTGTALPYWKQNIYPMSDKNEVDAVTGATKANLNFITSAKLKDSKIRKFTIYFEVDRSFDKNDWFTDQPAILYKEDINLDSPTKEYELHPCGWTPNEYTRDIIQRSPEEKLQKDMRFITNLKNGTGFGKNDTINQATNMVKRITVKILN